MARGPEGKIQDAVIKYAREKYGALCKKNEVGRYHVSSGWPDWAIFPKLKGMHRPFFIEFKAPGKELSPLQAFMRKDIESKGYKYYIVEGVHRGKQIIDIECE